MARVKRPNVKHEARLTGCACSMQDKGCNGGKSFELGAGQPLASMRLFGVDGVRRWLVQMKAITPVAPK